MKAWGRAVLLLTLAVLLAVVLRQHGGNVLITAPPWRVELSLTLAVLLLAVLFVVLYGGLRSLAWLTQGPDRVRQWRGQRAQRKDRAALEQGWIGVLEGRTREAEQQLARLLTQTRSTDTKVLAALALARSQHGDGRTRQRDETLAQARAAAVRQPRLQEAVAVVHAELLLSQHATPASSQTQAEQARHALSLLQPVFAANPGALNVIPLLLQAHSQLGHAPKVIELTRRLQRKEAIKPAQARAWLEKSIVAQLAALADLAHADAQTCKTRFKALWADLKREEKLWPAVALQAAGLSAMLHHDDPVQADKTAGKILEATLAMMLTQRREEYTLEEYTLDAALLDAWSHCAPPSVAERVARAEDWLKSAPDHVELLMTLGKLCLRGQLWGAAERYLQRSLTVLNASPPASRSTAVSMPVLPTGTADQRAFRTAARVHALLGSLYDQLGRMQTAVQHWRLAAGDGRTATPPLGTLPAADTRDDPGRPDIARPPLGHPAAVTPALPLAASAADYLMTDGLDNMDKDKAQVLAGLHAATVPFAAAAEDDLYFDSAVIPGVDLAQTSDQSGPHDTPTSHGQAD